MHLRHVLSAHSNINLDEVTPVISLQVYIRYVREMSKGGTCQQRHGT